MSNASQSAKQEAINKLREWIRPGDTIYTILRHVSRSGMQRSVSVLLLCDDNTAASDVPRVQVAPTDISMWVARALGDRIDQQHYGIKVSGCGMDMGFSIVYDLSRTLWPDGFGCVGKKCRSNDHSNGDRDYTLHYGGAVILKPSESVREVVWHERGDDDAIGDSIGIWGEVQPSGARAFTPQNGELTIYLFDDEVDSDEPARPHWHTDGGYALQQRWL